MIVAIVQARMGSSRLPGKILMDFCGKPSLLQLYDRLKRSAEIDKIVIATSANSINDPVRQLCKEHNIRCFSGSEDDVLERFYLAAKETGATCGDTLIRITGDCPLIDFELVDKVIECYKHSEADYACNSILPTFPDGLDCEVFDFSSIEIAYKEATLKSEREHVTLFIRNHPERFKLVNYANDIDYSYMRWTLDQMEDYIFINNIYESLYPTNPAFVMDDIIELLEKNPKMLEINSMYVRNEGLMKSLEADRSAEK
jgi:spore coat polysaccharide biosynthesis protein SpsF